ncbi:MAG: class I SAM-dependent methyltransferase [Ignavibacteriae bacterium]|nr:class I SAM-dependent methyltransferase [Ignavibacteriota bacterium]
MKQQSHYIPALKFHWLTPLFDPLMNIAMREITFKRQLIEQAAMQPTHRVLDLGCGTATLSILLKKVHPDIEVVGLDADRNVLSIAKSKIANAGLNVDLVEGTSDAIPYPVHYFDRVLSSLFFHHLIREEKIRALAEIFRVLKPGGELHVADWGKASNALFRIAFFPVQVLDGYQNTQDNVKGLLPQFFVQAGFTDVQEVNSYMTVFGTLSLYKAIKS